MINLDFKSMFYISVRIAHPVRSRSDVTPATFGPEFGQSILRCPRFNSSAPLKCTCEAQILAEKKEVRRRAFQAKGQRDMQSIQRKGLNNRDILFWKDRG